MSNLLVKAMVKETRKLASELRKLDTDVDVSYDVFKVRVLPLLANRGESFNVTDWIGLTSHPNVAIRVRDAANKVMYRIPAFLENAEIKTRKGMNLSAFTSDLNNMVADNPANKDSVLYNVLSAYKSDNVDMIVSSVESILVLNEIYIAHKMPTIEISEEMANTYKAAKGVDLTDIVANNSKGKIVDKTPVDDLFSSDYDLP